MAGFKAEGWPMDGRQTGVSCRPMKYRFNAASNIAASYRRRRGSLAAVPGHVR